MLNLHTSHSFRNLVWTLAIPLVLFSFLTITLPPAHTLAATQQAKSKPKSKPKSQPKSNPKSNPKATPTVAQTGQGNDCNSNNCDLINLYVNPFIRILGIIVGLVVAASIILGGIQYSASSGDPQKASAAKSRISNALLAFIAYAFLYAFLNFLIPGGIFH